MRLIFALILLVLANVTSAQSSIDAKLEAAMAAESRPDADRERDWNRRATDTLNFFGLEDDMRVLELIPGGGWYTRLLAPVLSDNGTLYLAIGTRRVAEGLLNEPGFENVELLEVDANIRRERDARFYSLDAFELGVSDLDMVLTFRNLHNFEPESRAMMNEQVFAALRSGGLYGIVDHTARHMEPQNNENRRRLDPVIVIKELLDIGFEFVDFTDLHYRPDDELEYEVGRQTVSGNTDRFTMLFRKP